MFDAAKAAGELQNRSAAQQRDHWARLGRELESSPAVSHEAIARALAGQTHYDTLDDRAQAVVRVSWDRQITERINGLDFEDRLQSGGGSWAEADTNGNIVMRRAGPSGPGA